MTSQAFEKTRRDPHEYRHQFIQDHHLAALFDAHPQAGDEGRQKSWRSFLEYGLPNTKHESFRYTDLKALAKNSFEWAAPQPRHGCFLSDTLGEKTLSVELGSTQALALSTTPGLNIKPLLSSTKKNNARTRPLWALGDALWTTGLVIEADGAVEPTLRILHSGSQGATSARSTKLQIRVAAGAQLKIIEEFVGEGLHLHETQIEVAENAECHHLVLQRTGSDATQLQQLRCDLGRDGRYRLHSIQSGSKLSRLDVDMHLNAEGADAKIFGLSLGTQNQILDHTLEVHHHKPHGCSEQIFRGIYDDKSRGIFSGKVVVDVDAQKTDAKQSNKNILLSKSAHVHTRPQLEVDADDVKCAHGATVGQLDASALFYLKQRGISARDAKMLLVHGFAVELFDELGPFSPLRDALQKELLGIEDTVFDFEDKT